MKKRLLLIVMIFLQVSITAMSQKVLRYNADKKQLNITTIDGTLTIIPLTDNAVRMIFSKQVYRVMPELVYVENLKNPTFNVKENNDKVSICLKNMTIAVDRNTGLVVYLDKNGKQILAENGRSLDHSFVGKEKTYIAEQHFVSPSDEHQYGLGQFQDGYLDVRGLSRRLTQVNTQISIPMILSNKGYGLLWNNYGLVDFNPSDNNVTLKKNAEGGDVTEVNVTTTAGNKKERRESNVFEADVNIAQEGDYSFLLDVGQKMARKLNLEIDGHRLINMENLWLPPTSSVIAHLSVGIHHVKSQLTNNDSPILYYHKVKDETVFRSPVSQSIDYTVFAGNADEAMAAYRKVTGEAPIMPLWALGYIHCRERFNSQHEILETANRFRKESFPVDMMVQDWQYWGKYGWNAMKFDEDRYPNVKAMTDSLHKMNIKFMVSVWSNTDHKTELGHELDSLGYFIPNTNWVDFFNPKAADFYWSNFSRRMLKPYGIDAWWQDATEPENDDLSGRLVNNGTTPGEVFRNTYPLLVNKTVYEGCRRDNPMQRTMILTRCSYTGIQRYSIANWSGDVGNDWDTFKRQVTAGLGLMAAGIPWWTYDAGGFFRPGNQYGDSLYHERFMRWMQTSVFLPLMRVHGYMSNTEFWNYGQKVSDNARQCLEMRYKLMPYIYSNAAAVSMDGTSIMRPFIMDFADDELALKQKDEYMFGKSLLVAPVFEQGISQMSVYLPKDTKWYDFATNKMYEGGETYQMPIVKERIPVYAKAGSIIPLGPSVQSTSEGRNAPWEIRIYGGADGKFTVYEDDGTSYNYEKGAYSTYPITWKASDHTLQIGQRQGTYKGMCKERKLKLVYINGEKQNVTKTVTYSGKKITLSF
mgnify:FL=1